MRAFRYTSKYCYAPGATARAEAATLATKGRELFMGTVGATQAQEAAG
jgi:hypothetical protein